MLLALAAIDKDETFLRKDKTYNERFNERVKGLDVYPENVSKCPKVKRLLFENIKKLISIESMNE